MMSKILTASVLVIGLVSVGANAGPKRQSESSARAMTRQLNEQQLASNGSIAQQPGTVPEATVVPSTQVPPAETGVPANAPSVDGTPSSSTPPTTTGPMPPQ